MERGEVEASKSIPSIVYYFFVGLKDALHLAATTKLFKGSLSADFSNLVFCCLSDLISSFRNILRFFLRKKIKGQYGRDRKTTTL